jgi:hypothetical protein
MLSLGGYRPLPGRWMTHRSDGRASYPQSDAKVARRDTGIRIIAAGLFVTLGLGLVTKLGDGTAGSVYRGVA